MSDDADVAARARYCRDWGNFDPLHEELLAELEQMRELVRRGLPYGQMFRTVYAAGARAELRRKSGMKSPVSGGGFVMGKPAATQQNPGPLPPVFGYAGGNHTSVIKARRPAETGPGLRQGNGVPT